MLRMEVERVHAAVGNLFGYHCLQVGDLAGVDLLSASRILGRTVVDIDGGATHNSYPLVTGAATSLPIDSHAVDVVILPHVLEFESRPHEALRESSRVLVPEGSLVVLGFNPLSIIGLRRVFKHRAEVAPWCGTYFGAGRLRDWLTLLGFDIVDQRPCFASKHGAHPWQSRGRSFVEWIPPALASARLILAKKRVNAVLPIEALEALRRPCRVRLVTDSAYLTHGITQGLGRWKRTGWRTADRKSVRNTDLWRRLDEAASLHDVEWVWVRGHAGHEGNEKADALARSAVKERTS